MDKRNKVHLARTLRRKQTDAELRLWTELRNLCSDGIRFRRQHPIGDYIVDFVCLEKRLIIEADGGQHNEVIDAQRVRWLEKEGFRVIRFWNNDIIENMEGVIFRVKETLGIE